MSDFAIRQGNDETIRVTVTDDGTASGTPKDMTGEAGAVYEYEIFGNDGSAKKTPKSGTLAVRESLY